MRLFYRSRLTVYEVAERFRKRLLSADARSARTMRNAYVEAERAITAELKAIVKRIDAAVAAGLPIESAWGLRRLEVEALLRRIGVEINGFAELAAKTASAQQSLFAGLGAEHAQALAKAAGVTAGFRRLNESALVDLMGSLERGSPLYDLFRELGPRAASHARTVFAKAAATGANPKATAKALVRDIRGLSSTRALVIARTETMRSYRTATQRSFAANAGVITGWQWMAAHQARTCPVCLAMDGTVHGVDEVMHSHPSCRCSMVPITAYSNPPRETGAQWLQRQPEEIQRQVLGPTKLELWRSGAISLSDLIKETEHPRWGRGRQEATITQALAKAGQVPAKSVRGRGRVNAPATSPLPQAPTTWQPNTGAASQSLDLLPLSNSAPVKRARAAMASIDSVHGVGTDDISRFKIPAIIEPKQKAQGEFIPIYRGVGAGTPVRIEISAKAKSIEYTLAHEFGHFVDFVGAGRPIMNGMSANAQNLDPALEKLWHNFFDAAARTPQIQALLEGRASSRMTWNGSVYDVSPHGIQEDLKYHLYPWEVWARAYAQFIGVRSKSKPIRDYVNELRTSGVVNWEFKQWNDSEFADIEIAVELILKRLGMMQ